MSERYNYIHEFVEKCLDKWIPIMGLEKWSISRSYFPGLKTSSTTTLMEIGSVWEYSQATFNVYLPTLSDMTDSQLEGIVVHELCHPLVMLMRGKKETKEKIRREEKTVCGLARALLLARYPTICPQEFLF